MDNEHDRAIQSLKEKIDQFIGAVSRGPSGTFQDTVGVPIGDFMNSEDAIDNEPDERFVCDCCPGDERLAPFLNPDTNFLDQVKLTSSVMRHTPETCRLDGMMMKQLYLTMEAMMIDGSKTVLEIAKEIHAIHRVIFLKYLERCASENAEPEFPLLTVRKAGEFVRRSYSASNARKLRRHIQIVEELLRITTNYLYVCPSGSSQPMLAVEPLRVVSKLILLSRQLTKELDKEKEEVRKQEIKYVEPLAKIVSDMMELQAARKTQEIPYTGIGEAISSED